MATRVYVGGLSHRFRERDVEKIVRKFGKVREVALKNGYGFVEFDDYRDADDACYELNGKEINGERLIVQLARGTPHGRDRDRWGGYDSHRGPRRSRRSSPTPTRRRDSREGRRPGWLDKYGPPTHTDYRLVVENLSTRVSWQDLKDYVRQAGDVTYADAHKNRRNEGYVEFANEQDMKNAIEKLDGSELNGRKIRLVQEKNRRISRSRSRSKSRSTSRRRSHSSRSRSTSRRRSRSRSHSTSRRRSRSVSRSRSKSRSKERRTALSREKSRSNSPKERNGKSQSRSRSRSSNVGSPAPEHCKNGDDDKMEADEGSKGDE